jgi:hypothetical protein
MVFMVLLLFYIEKGSRVSGKERRVAARWRFLSWLEQGV